MLENARKIGCCPDVELWFQNDSYTPLQHTPKPNMNGIPLQQMLRGMLESVLEQP